MEGKRFVKFKFKTEVRLEKRPFGSSCLLKLTSPFFFFFFSVNILMRNMYVLVISTLWVKSARDWCARVCVCMYDFKCLLIDDVCIYFKVIFFFFFFAFATDVHSWLWTDIMAENLFYGGNGVMFYAISKTNVLTLQTKCSSKYNNNNNSIINSNSKSDQRNLQLKDGCMFMNVGQHALKEINVYLQYIKKNALKIGDKQQNRGYKCDKNSPAMLC